MVELSEQFGQPYYPHRGSPEKRAQPTQGKLFSDPKPTDEHRYQRGYTPERMEAVRQQPIHVYTGENRRGQKGAPFTGPAGAARVWDTLARSTLPADHIRSRYNGDALKIKTASPEVSSSANAHYRYSQFGGHGEIHLGRDSGEQRMGQSLLHEVGHAHSTQEVLPHSRPETRQELGQEEAYADDTMVRHWRPDPRDARRGNVREVTPGYEHPETFKGTTVPFARSSGRGNQTGGKTAHRAYMAARTTPLMAPDRERRWRAERNDAAFQPRLNTDQFKEHGGWTQGPAPVINEHVEAQKRIQAASVERKRKRSPF